MPENYKLGKLADRFVLPEEEFPQSLGFLLGDIFEDDLRSPRAFTEKYWEYSKDIMGQSLDTRIVVPLCLHVIKHDRRLETFADSPVIFVDLEQ